MNKKNIIYTGAFRFPFGDPAAPRVLNNAKIFKKLGYNVIFICWGGIPQDEDKHEDGSFYYQGFRYINSYDIDIKQNNLIKRIYSFFLYGRNSLKIIEQMINDVAFVIGYNPPMIFSNSILKLCRKNNIPFISDITEWHSSNEFPGGKLALPAWINELNMRFIQKRVGNKIVISSFLYNYYCLSNNILLPPLVDSNEPKWQNNKLKLPYFDGVRLIYAGAPAKKDLLYTILDAVIECIKRKIKLQFIILGISKDNIFRYEKYNEVLSMSENILLLGRIPQNEVPAYYKNSDFSIIIREKNRKSMAGFPTKLAETMMSGCPVILNYTSDISDYVHDGYNGIVVIDDSSTELQKSLLHIVTLSKEEKDLMKRNAIKCAFEKFDYSNYIYCMERFIKKTNYY